MSDATFDLLLEGLPPEIQEAAKTYRALDNDALNGEYVNYLIDWEQKRWDEHQRSYEEVVGAKEELNDRLATISEWRKPFCSKSV